MEQLRRAFDVREKKGDGAGRKVALHVSAIMRRAVRRVQF
jgi:hypothetical protein